MKKNKVFHSLFQMPLLALLFMAVACSTDEEPVAQIKHVEEKEAHIPKPEGIESQEDTTVYKAMDQMPVFQGGEELMYKFLQDNIRYPKEAKESGTEGIVVLGLIVEKDGSVKDVKIWKSLSTDIDNEAVRVAKMTDKKWEPGKHEGKPVRAQYALPIRFTIN